MGRWTRGKFMSVTERSWNWTFWAAILAFEVAGVFLSAQA